MVLNEFNSESFKTALPLYSENAFNTAFNSSHSRQPHQGTVKWFLLHLIRVILDRLAVGQKNGVYCI
jgi:hypothetical protein